MSETNTAVAARAFFERMSATQDRMGRPLHIVRRGDYPRALCGYIVQDEFNPARTDTRGRDRCAQCLAIARGRRIG
jgi:hypothetical protein